MVNLKKVIQFVIILIPWFLSGILFTSNNTYYKSLNLPFFAPPGILFPIVWTILYILIAISVFTIYQKYDRKYITSYTKTLITNYIFNQLFTLFFFTLENTFLGFVDCVATLITALFLYYETKELDKKASNFLLPYVFWCLFATILSLTIYFMNL